MNKSFDVFFFFKMVIESRVGRVGGNTCILGPVVGYHSC